MFVISWSKKGKETTYLSDISYGNPRNLVYPKSFRAAVSILRSTVLHEAKIYATIKDASRDINGVLDGILVG